MAAPRINFLQRHVEWPWKFSLGEWWLIIKRVRAQTSQDNIGVLAAGVAFFSLLAIFPMISAAISIYGFFADPADVVSQTQVLEPIMPKAAFEIVNGQVLAVAGASGKSLGFRFVISVLIALYSAGAGIRAIIRSMNVAYGEAEKRNFLLRYSLAFGMTLGGFIFAYVSLLIIIGVPAFLSFVHLDELFDSLGLSGALGYILAKLPWVLLMSLFCFAAGIVYRFGPSRRPARKRWVYPGILLTVISWLGISYGFSKFVSTFDRYNAVYGSISAVIILLIWFWLTAFIVMVGAELNAELERQTLADTTRGPDRPVGERGAAMADWVSLKTQTRHIKKMAPEPLSPNPGSSDT